MLRYYRPFLERTQWWMDRNVIRRVVERLVPDESSDVHANVSQLLCDIPRRFSGLCSDIIMNELLSESTITALVDRVVERVCTLVSFLSFKLCLYRFTI